MPSLERSLIEDIRFLKENPYVRSEIEVRGFIFKIDSGELEEVIPEKVEGLSLPGQL